MAGLRRISRRKLKDLHDRVHRGSYRARPARRTYIPKADGSKRPLSILCLEDKIVQQAVAYVPEAIYDEDFLGFSYGFRPGRGQHDALDALHAGIYRKQVNWVLDMAHSWTIRFLQHRIADKRILRLIAKWLKVGITEDGRVTRSERGTPQGAVISPILANVYLHYVYDLWTHRWRRKATGDVIVIRYADDTIVGFQHEHEAKAFLHDLQERMREFELALHPAKTRLIRSVAMRPSNVRNWERGGRNLSTSSALHTSARDHANGARSLSGARRSRSGC
jgi:group II intron reverse transcriptase/maturase